MRPVDFPPSAAEPGAARKPRIGIYPDVNQDGIGTYIKGIKDLLGVETVPCPVGILSPRQFFHRVPPGFDLIHVPHFLVPFDRRGFKVVCTIQDIIPVVLRGNLGFLRERYLGFRIAWSVKKADHVIFTSENTLKDVTRVFGPVKNHTIVPLAMDAVLPEEAIPGPSYPFPYYLCVGRRRRHKNIEGILRAFAKTAGNGSHLVFGGKEDIHDASWKVLAEKLGIASKVHFAGFLTREQLAGHYRHALALLFPSLYEGFGLPILEAMSYGCPVITSNCSSMPEVAGGAALLVNPRDFGDIVSALAKIESEPDFRAELIGKGYENCRRFSWEKTGAGTAEVYRKTLEGPGHR